MYQFQAFKRSGKIFSFFRSYFLIFHTAFQRHYTQKFTQTYFSHSTWTHHLHLTSNLRRFCSFLSWKMFGNSWVKSENVEKFSLLKPSPASVHAINKIFWTPIKYKVWLLNTFFQVYDIFLLGVLKIFNFHTKFWRFWLCFMPWFNKQHNWNAFIYLLNSRNCVNYFWFMSLIILEKFSENKAICSICYY